MEVGPDYDSASEDAEWEDDEAGARGSEGQDPFKLTYAEVMDARYIKQVLSFIN